MDFGIRFFSSTDRPLKDRPYGLLLDAARFADDHGFVAVWTPERHFHPFGGLFPNPALTSAGLATIDFVFFSDRYEPRVETMFEQIRTVQSLWSGTRLERINSYVACLVDFGVAEPEVLGGLERLDELRRSMTAERVAVARRAAVDSFVEDLEEA